MILDYFVGWEVDATLYYYVSAFEDGEFTIVENEDGLFFKFKTNEWRALGIKIEEVE